MAHSGPHEGLERELEAMAQRAGGKLTLARPLRDYARSAVVRRQRAFIFRTV